MGGISIRIYDARGNERVEVMIEDIENVVKLDIYNIAIPINGILQYEVVYKDSNEIMRAGKLRYGKDIQLNITKPVRLFCKGDYYIEVFYKNDE